MHNLQKTKYKRGQHIQKRVKQMNIAKSDTKCKNNKIQKITTNIKNIKTKNDKNAEMSKILQKSRFDKNGEICKKTKMTKISQMGKIR